MLIYRTKSYAKINLSLGVLGKLQSKLHRIESLISFIDLYDEIIIQRTNNDKHNVVFYVKSRLLDLYDPHKPIIFKSFCLTKLKIMG